MEQLVHDIDVECLPVNITEKIIINIDSLDIGKSIHLKDIEKIDNVRFTGMEDTVIVHIVHAKAVVEAAPVEAEVEGAPAAEDTAKEE